MQNQWKWTENTAEILKTSSRCQRVTKREPKEHNRSQKKAKGSKKWAKKEPKGREREPKGAEREPKGTKMEPKGSQMWAKSGFQNRCPKKVAKKEVPATKFGVIFGPFWHAKNDEKPLVFIAFSWFTTFANKYVKWNKKGANMGPKMDEKSSLGWFFVISGSLLGHPVFAEI